VAHEVAAVEVGAGGEGDIAPDSEARRADGGAECVAFRLARGVGGEGDGDVKGRAEALADAAGDGAGAGAGGDGSDLGDGGRREERSGGAAHRGPVDGAEGGHGVAPCRWARLVPAEKPAGAVY